MIDEIHVQNIALIKDVHLTLSAGLTVMTGETGAGKTALLSALKLLMGERADSSTVREGTQAAVVEGRLFTSASDTEGFVVNRRLTSDGRSRVKIDGGLASVSELALRVGPLIDICGQHEHQRLLDPVRHLSMIDTWAHSSIEPALEEYRESLKGVRSCRKKLEELQRLAKMQGSQLEEARFTVERIDEVDPKSNELEELEELLPRAEHAEALASCAHDSQSLLSDEGGSLDSLNSAISELMRMGRVDNALARYADTLSEAAITIEDVSSDLRSYRDSVDFDPSKLSAMQDRYSELKGLLRQFGPSMDDVFAARDRARELLSVVDNSTERIARAQASLDDAEKTLSAKARLLARAREIAGPRFCRAVNKQLTNLEMGQAELSWQVRELDRKHWTEMGTCTYEFLYRSGSGLTPRPLKRIASGGELSRIMLAASIVMGNEDGVDTLVFDEIDAGVGGATARSLASVLADLSRTHQVIVVTHTAQIAVCADTHYIVSKIDGDTPETVISACQGEERVREVARMLSGDTEAASLDHARALLKESEQIRR